MKNQIGSPRSTEAEIHRAWVELPSATDVACEADGRVAGTYFIKPNQAGLGSQREAVSLNFRAMQFNLVVATNERAIRLWQKLGFSVAGTLPRAF
jgi:RimJ/RimL family protein N-acetyltransferase